MSDAANVFNLEKEYYTLFEVVNKFDDRLITVKEWSVTLSLVALGGGFQFQHYGLFLVACLSSLGFWIIEALMKRHQMRYYARMREIEIFRSTLMPNASKNISTPQIDWSWEKAPNYFKGERPSSPQWYNGNRLMFSTSDRHFNLLITLIKKVLISVGHFALVLGIRQGNKSYVLSWAFGHVALPHVISVVAGITFFVLGRTGMLGSMGW